MATEYIETYEFPSGCILEGYEDIPLEVTLRAMKTKEEKMLLGSTGNNVFDKILGSCLEEPVNLPLGKLILSDKHFLMMKLRILSYGSDYHVKHKCEWCEKVHEYPISLDDVPINNLDDDFIEPFEFELPMSKDMIGIKLLRDMDNRKVERRAKQINRKTKGNLDGDISYILRLVERLVTVNGESIKNKQKYVEDLHGRDSAYIQHKLDTVEVGYDLKMYEECPYCGNDVDFILPMTSEFFRPRFND